MKINDKLQEAEETGKKRERERKGQQLQGQMNLCGQKKKKQNNVKYAEKISNKKNK